MEGGGREQSGRHRVDRRSVRDPHPNQLWDHKMLPKGPQGEYQYEKET
jgi:hypothetical protein